MNLPLSVKLYLQSAILNSLICPLLSVSLFLPLTPIFSLQRLSLRQSLQLSANTLFSLPYKEGVFSPELSNQSRAARATEVGVSPTSISGQKSLDIMLFGS